MHPEPTRRIISFSAARPRLRSQTSVREFAQSQFSLRDAPQALRMIYAGFLLLAAIGLATQVGFQAGRIGLRPTAIARYYRGDDAGLVMAFPKTFGQMLEVTHAHAFFMA